ncbi:outer membrane beta-barrel protein [Sunxiuqinia sp. A32]|uniref:outer membrane beta-barrel protein n=1 Tax=Sunxiuqinia sp. A32 TaxID=3461496 RepID=UPI004045D3CD
MKKFAILLIIALCAQVVSAQNDYRDQEEINTIFSKRKSNGGYGAISFSYSEIDGKDAFNMGARGGWIIDHSFAIGLGGNGFVNDINYHNILENDLDYNLAGGYGGLFIEPIIGSKLPVHLSFPVLFGVGGVAYIENHNHWDYWWSDNESSDVFFVIEPAVELEFNMTRHFRMAATASYRFTSDIEMINTDPDILNGFSAGLVFKFGKF